MAAVVRIKRRLSQEPAEALLLVSSTKRFKAGHGPLKEEPNIFKFCGTVDDQEKNLDIIAKLVEKGQKTSHQDQVKRKSTNGSRMTPSSSQEKRLKLLNQLRKVDESSASFRLYDLVSEQQSPKTSTSSTSDVVLCNGVPLLVEKASPAPEEAFVFDVYYAHCGDIDDTYIDQLLSVQPYSLEQQYAESDEAEEDEDSNDENNWRNDYPDTEEDDEDRWSDGELDLATGLTRMKLNESDLSSEDEGDLIYSKDDCDDKESPAYAAFKKRIARQLQEDDYDDERDDDSVSDEVSD